MIILLKTYYLRRVFPEHGHQLYILIEIPNARKMQRIMWILRSMNSKTNHNNSYWNQPVLFLESKNEKWGLIIFLAAYIPLFLLIFQPFGVNNYDPTHRISLEFFIAAMGFGLINGLMLFIYEFGITPYLFNKNARFIFIIRMALEFILLSTTTFLFYNYF